MSAGVQQAKRIWTEQELQSLPDSGYTYEVIDGELIMSPKNDFFHGDICAELLTALRTYAKAKRLGVVLDSSTGFWMANRNCRAPDISFVSKARLRGGPPKGFFEGAPDLAIEVLARSNTPQDIKERLDDFFESGTKVAWLINPQRRFVEVCHSQLDRRILGPGADLDGEDILPGFRYPIADLFKEWEWD
jgi:Uma2 family endonuclease